MTKWFISSAQINEHKIFCCILLDKFLKQTKIREHNRTLSFFRIRWDRMLICSLRFTAHLAAFLDSSMVPPSLGLLPEDSLVPGSESSVNAKFVSILKTKSLNRWVVTSESHHNQGSHLLNPCFLSLCHVNSPWTKKAKAQKSSSYSLFPPRLGVQSVYPKQFS